MYLPIVFEEQLSTVLFLKMDKNEILGLLLLNLICKI